MPGIGVIFNPRSGHNLRDPKAVRKLHATLGDHGMVRAAGSIDELYRVAEDFRKQNIDVLGISGGDGTNGVTITGFLNVYENTALPQIAFLRGGTMNTVANAVGIRKGRPEGLLHRLIQAYVERSSLPLDNVERHVLKLRPLREALSTRRGQDLYGFIFGTGVVCGYLAEYYRDGPPNPLIAARTLVRGIGSAMVGGPMIRRMAAPFRGSVKLDDGTLWPDRDYLSVACGTIDQIGLNFRPFYRFAERPETFHVLGIHTSALRFVAQLPRIWRARPMREGHAFEATPQAMTVYPSESHLRYMVDGDLHACEGPLSVSIGPRVRIVVGT
jgi:hypothetical protein